MPVPVTLSLGRRPLPALMALLEQRDVHLNAYAHTLLPTLTVAPTPHEACVVVRTVAELGWPAGATLDQVFSTLPRHGLAPCSHETALLLRLAWHDRRVDPRVTVAAERALPDELQPRGFYLRDDEHGSWLRAYVATDDWVFAPEERLALTKRSLPSLSQIAHRPTEG